MRNRRLILLLIIALMLLIPLAPAQRVVAADSWVCDYDFLDSDGGWVSTFDGVYTPTVGWTDTWLPSGPNQFRGLQIQLNFSATTIIAYTLDYTIVKGNFTATEISSTGIYDNLSHLLDSATYSASLGASGTYTFTWVGSYSGVEAVGTNIQAGIRNDGIDPTGSVTVTAAHLEGEGVSPCGIGGSDDDSGGNPPTSALALYTNCPLLGLDNANFTNLPGNWTLSGDAEQAEGSTNGLQLLHGSAELTMMLSAEHRYSITVNYTNTTNELIVFRVGLGNSTAQSVSVNPLSVGSYISPPANYSPGMPTIQEIELENFADSFFTDTAGPTTSTAVAGFYTLLIAGAPDGYTYPEDQPPLTIKSVCIKDETPGAVGGGTGAPSATSVPAECTAGCAFTLNGLAVGSILDIPGALGQILEGLINYLLCGLLKFLRCVVMPALGGLWTTIQTIYLYFNIARAWLGLAIQSGGGWFAAVLHVLAEYFGGTASNFIQAIVNAALSLLNSLGIVDIVNSVLTFIQSLFGGTGNIFGFVGSLIQAIGVLISAVFDFLINVLLAKVIEVIQTVVAIFASLISAFNAPAIAPPGVISCDTSASMIPASCVGLFTIDNSVLADGSLVWPMVPLIQGAAGIGAIWWGVNRLKRGLIGNVE